MNGTFIRIGDLAPNESLQSTNDSAPNKKLNIQKAGILYTNLLNFRANSDGSRSRSGGLAIDNELRAIKRSKLFMFFDCVIIITVFIQKTITRKEEQTLYQSFIRIIECKV
jgi:hypothetical protein